MEFEKWCKGTKAEIPQSVINDAYEKLYGLRDCHNIGAYSDE